MLKPPLEAVSQIFVDGDQAGYCVADLQKMIKWWESRQFGRDPYNFDELELNFFGFPEVTS